MSDKIIWKNVYLTGFTMEQTGSEVKATLLKANASKPKVLDLLKRTKAQYLRRAAQEEYINRQNKKKEKQTQENKFVTIVINDVPFQVKRNNPFGVPCNSICTIL